VSFGGVEVEPFVQVHPNTQTTLVDGKEASQPRAEEGDHRGVAVGEDDPSVALRPFACVEGSSGGKERRDVECTDARHTDTIELLDLTALAILRRVRTALRPPSALARGERDVADPERDRRLRDTELVGDLLERASGRAEVAGGLLLADLASVAHGSTVRRRCDTIVRCRAFASVS
jgi:hypothetical protein